MDHPQNFIDLATEKGLKLVYLNIRSLFKKIDQLRKVMDGAQVEIVTLSETWLRKEMDSRLINIYGYRSFRLDRDMSLTSKKRGGGLITYVKSNPDMDVYILSNESTSNRDIEAQWIRLENKNSKNILQGNIYRPPNGNIDRAIKYLDKHIKNLKGPNEDIILMGDFNIDYKNKTTPAYKKLLFF